jgi:NADH-quinone oxidoreductase subunit B
MGLIDNRFESNIITTSLDMVFNWARKSALWPMSFGLACCAIEMMATVALALRHRSIRRRSLPATRTAERSDDCGRHGRGKMGPIVKRLYDQMPDPSG